MKYQDLISEAKAICWDVCDDGDCSHTAANEYVACVVIALARGRGIVGVDAVDVIDELHELDVIARREHDERVRAEALMAAAANPPAEFEL